MDRFGSSAHYHYAPVASTRLGTRDPNATAKPADGQSMFGRSTASAAALDVPRRETRAPESSAVTGLQFSGLTMQLELERSKREDADRLLREQMSCQMQELRHSVDHVSRENASLREWIGELRRNGGSNVSSAAGDGAAGDHAKPVVSAAQWSSLKDRVEDLESRTDRHQRTLEDRNARLETAVSEFCAAHLGIEMERLRATARESARGSVETLVEERMSTLMASWTGAFSELQNNVNHIVGGSRESIATVTERLEAHQSTIGSMRADVDQCRDHLRNLGETRTLVASITSLRAEHERHLALFRERSNEWATTEATLTSAVRGLQDKLEDARASIAASVSKRLDSITSNAVSRADMMAAIERSASSGAVEIRQCETAVASIKAQMESLKAHTESRLSAVDGTVRLANEAAVAGVAAAEDAARGVRAELAERISALEAAVPPRSAFTDLESRLNHRVATCEVAQRDVQDAAAAVKADVVDASAQLETSVGALRSRVDSAEQAIATMRRTVASVKSDTEERTSSIDRVEGLLADEREHRQRLQHQFGETAQRVTSVEGALERRVEELRVLVARSSESSSNVSEEVRKSLLVESRAVASEVAQKAATSLRAELADQNIQANARSSPTPTPSSGMSDNDIKRAVHAATAEAVHDLRTQSDDKLDEAVSAMNRRCDQLSSSASKNLQAQSERFEQRVTDVAESAADSIARVNDAQASLKVHTDTALRRVDDEVKRLRENVTRTEATAETVTDQLNAVVTSVEAEQAKLTAVQQKALAALDVRLNAVEAREVPQPTPRRRAASDSEDDDDFEGDDVGARRSSSRRVTAAFVRAAIDERASDLYDRLAPKAKAAADEAAAISRRVYTIERQVATLEATVDVPSAQREDDDDAADDGPASSASVVDYVDRAMSRAEERINAAATRAARHHEQRLRETEQTVSSVGTTVGQLEEALADQRRVGSESAAIIKQHQEELRSAHDRLAETLNQLRDSHETQRERIAQVEQLQLLQKEHAASAPGDEAPLSGAAEAQLQAELLSVLKRLEDVELTSEVNAARLKEFEAKVRDTQENVNSISKHAASAAANAANDAFERYRNEVSALQTSLQSAAASPRSSDSPKTDSSNNNGNDESGGGGGLLVWRQDMTEWRDAIDQDLDRVIARLERSEDQQRITDARLSADRTELRSLNTGLGDMGDRVEKVTESLLAVEGQLAEAIQGIADGIVAHVVDLKLPLPSTDTDPNTGDAITVDVAALQHSEDLELADVCAPLWSALAGQAVASHMLQLGLSETAARLGAAMVDLRQVISIIAEHLYAAIQGDGVEPVVIPWLEASHGGGSPGDFTTSASNPRTSGTQASSGSRRHAAGIAPRQQGGGYETSPDTDEEERLNEDF